MDYHRWIFTICSVSLLSVSLFASEANSLGFDFTGIFLLFLLILSGVFSGSEVALLSLSAGKIHAMVEEGLTGAKAVEKLKADPNKMLIVILIGNNLVNIGASVLTTAWASRVFGNEILGIVTGVLTILVLVFGEIFPKIFAQKYADKVARVIARPLLILQFIFSPIIFILEIILKFAMKFSGSNEDKSSSIAEIKALVKLASSEGHLGAKSQNIISNSLFFNKVKVEDIMTVNTQVIMIDVNATLESLKSLFIQSGRSRIPIYQDSINNIIGVVNMKMYLEAEDDFKTFVSEISFNKPVVLQKDVLAIKALGELQAHKEQMAMIYDQEEFIGLITIENILEEIVGEMFDEKEKNEKFVRVADNGIFDVKADCTIFDFRKHFKHFEANEPDFKSIETLFEEKFDGDYDDIEIGSKIENKKYIIKVKKMRKDTIILFRIYKK